MLERKFQAQLICEITEMFPNCVVLKNDPNYIQGFPDLTILTDKGWALLECKKSKDEKHQPNQDYYIDWAKKNSYGSFIFPENKEEVLCELQSALQSNRKTRVSKRKQVSLAPIFGREISDDVLECSGSSERN